jgi:hypothetical protein
MTMPTPDTWRIASLLIERHGAAAERIAVRRIEEINEQNDLGDMLTWMRIRSAIVELQARRSTPSN